MLMSLPKQPSSENVPKPPDPSSAADFYGLFHSTGKVSGTEDHKLKSLRHRLITAKGVAVRDSAILWALRSVMAAGDADIAYNLLLAMSDASEGLVRNYDSSVKLRGAQNRQGVTCYLDATLFAMFSRLDSFEAMLYNDFTDPSRNKLSFLLRLWVNLLRSGLLITVDITQVIQDAIAQCGWGEAGELRQQDASEAFTFITGKLELPLLTLKMDIYHTGREDASDDHKFINERLLDVAIPEDPSGNRKDITLEDCLEDYFNNRIEVRRYLERRSTLSSKRSFDKKGGAVHVETVEVEADSSPSTPISSSPMKSPPPSRPNARSRTQSIIQERYIPARGESGYSSLTAVDTKDSSRSRAGSVRKEVMMPAWQFFSLIPWYTDNAPSNDAQVAAHFSTKRPVLGLCLKRYAMRKGKAIRLNTKIDIPIEIGLPHFIQDDPVADGSASFGSFKLSLQSVVCHRGNSVNSGHYVALVRGTTANPSSTGRSIEDSRHWMRFDDLAHERITLIDVETALREETPYLLFYQIVPMDGDPGHITAGENPSTNAMTGMPAPDGGISTMSLPLSSTGPSSGRPSFEMPFREDLRGRSPTEARRPSSVSFSDTTLTEAREVINTVSPGTTTPAELSSGSLSRTQSRGSNGIGRRLSKLAKRKSGEHVQDNSVVSEIVVREVSATSTTADGELQRPTAPKPNTLAVAPPPKPQKRDRSANRLVKSGGKAKEHKPDRECVVM